VASPLTRRAVATVASLILLVVAAVWIVVGAEPEARGLVVMVALAGLGAVAFGLRRRQFAGVVLGTVVMLVGHLLALVDHDVATLPALGYGVLLLVAVELAADATLGGVEAFPDARARRDRTLEIVVAVGASIVGGVVVVAARDVFRDGGAAQLLGAAVAAVGLVLLVAALTRRATTDPSPRDRDR
jgi:hypothetical protein